MMHTAKIPWFTICGMSVVSITRMYLVGLPCVSGMGKAAADVVPVNHAALRQAQDSNFPSSKVLSIVATFPTWMDGIEAVVVMADEN
jgi:hypothetical protein